MLHAINSAKEPFRASCSWKHKALKTVVPYNPRALKCYDCWTVVQLNCWTVRSFLFFGCFNFWDNLHFWGFLYFYCRPHFWVIFISGIIFMFLGRLHFWVIFTLGLILIFVVFFLLSPTLSSSLLIGGRITSSNTKCHVCNGTFFLLKVLFTVSSNW